MPDAPLLMIPGPVEVSPAVRESFSAPPPGHLAPRVLEAFGGSLAMMREIWMAAPDAQPFVVGGGGTLAMDMAAANLVEPGDHVLVLNTGFFSERMAEMLRRLGAVVHGVVAGLGEVPSIEDVHRAADEAGREGNVRGLFATHVDTSTGVRIDPRPLAALAREREILSVFDGVCATAGERFEMQDWGADVYLTGSQKAIGLPPGLALMVASVRAVEIRRARHTAPPPMVLDWLEWLPIMQAYERREPAYFSTPPTNLILALETGLGEILADGIERRFDRHRRAADALRRSWKELGLRSVPSSPELAAHTLSALYYPAGVDASLIGRILKHGVIVAGGLHPDIKSRYFRIGHMGHAVVATSMLERTVRAVELALRDH